MKYCLLLIIIICLCACATKPKKVIPRRDFELDRAYYQSLFEEKEITKDEMEELINDLEEMG